MQYKARAGYTITIDGSRITLKEFMKDSEVTFDKSEISEVELRRGVYDIPFLEKSIALRLKNGKKYVIRRLKKKEAEEIRNQLL